MAVKAVPPSHCNELAPKPDVADGLGDTAKDEEQLAGEFANKPHGSKDAGRRNSPSDDAELL